MVLAVSAALAGLVTAPYVAYPDGAAPRRSEDRLGVAGGAFYARLTRENSCQLPARSSTQERAMSAASDH